MLRDPEKKVVYVPISEALLPELEEWSDPVQVKLERVAGDFSLVFRKLSLQPVELSQGRGA